MLKNCVGTKVKNPLKYHTTLHFYRWNHQKCRKNIQIQSGKTVKAYLEIMLMLTKCIKKKGSPFRLLNSRSDIFFYFCRICRTKYEYETYIN